MRNERRRWRSQVEMKERLLKSQTQASVNKKPRLKWDLSEAEKEMCDNIDVGEADPGFNINTSDNNIVEDQDMGEQEYSVGSNEDCEKDSIIKFGTQGRDDESVESLEKGVRKDQESENLEEGHEDTEIDIVEVEEEDIGINEVLEEYSQTEGDDEDIEVEKRSNTDRDVDDKISKSDEERCLDQVTIGKAVSNFNIHKSIFFTHNYFRKVLCENGIYALCIICWKMSRTRILVKIQEHSNTRGKTYLVVKCPI